MRFRFSALSENGPRKLNEDSFVAWLVRPGCFAAAIADGLGGMGGGSEASKLAVQTFSEEVPKIKNFSMELTAVAGVAHERILTMQSTRPELRSMATTLTGVVIAGNQLSGIHCGDSRAAIARRSGIMRLTSDHSEGVRLHKAGKLSKQELHDYPRQHVLESALGIHRAPQIDCFSFAVEAGDKLFLTTDGVHNLIFLREIRDIAARHTEPESFVGEIADVVETREPTDNYSIIAIYIDD